MAKKWGTRVTTNQPKRPRPVKAVSWANHDEADPPKAKEA